MALAPERFILLGTTEDTVKEMVRKLNFIFENLTAGDSVDLGNVKIGAGNIDFGIESYQVKASNIPIIDEGHIYISGEVEAALQEVMNTLLGIKAVDIPIEDVSEIFDSENVETALHEVMTKLDEQKLSDHADTYVEVEDPLPFEVEEGDFEDIEISDPPEQKEVEALRDMCELLSIDCRLLRDKVQELTETLRGYGLV